MSTKGSFSSAPKKGTSGCRKNFFFLDPHSRGPMKQHTQKSDKNSKKKLLGLRGLRRSAVIRKGVGPGPTLAWPGWKQPDIPVEVETDRLETSRREAGVLKKLSIAGIAKLRRLKYS